MKEPFIVSRATQSVTKVLDIVDIESLVGDRLDIAQKFPNYFYDFISPNRLVVSTEGGCATLNVRDRTFESFFAVPMQPALYAPDGRHACIINGFDLTLLNLSSGINRELTRGGRQHEAFGQQSETALSAISYRKKPFPLGIWSPDSQWFLTHRIKETDLPEISIVECTASHTRPIVHSYKYPVPGDPLPRGTWLAIHVATGKTIEFVDCPFDISAVSPLFMKRVWFGSNSDAYFIKLDRYCHTMALIRMDLSDGSTRLMLSETADRGYLECTPNVLGIPNIRTLTKSNEVVWYSERDGFGHLYLYDLSSGLLKNPITKGSWQVRDIVDIDEDARMMFFLASGISPEADPALRSLCRVQLDGSGFEEIFKYGGDVTMRVTPPAGFDADRPFSPSHAYAGFNNDHRACVLRLCSLTEGVTTVLLDLNHACTLQLSAPHAVARKVRVREFSVPAADQNTSIHGALFLPPEFDETSCYPLIDYIYPGPQINQKPTRYGSVMSGPAFALAELGFIVMMLNTRGMPARSKAIHQTGYGHLLEPQLSDHANAVETLCARHPFIDQSNIGAIGTSGGGAAVARLLFDYGSLYKVGISASGNHNSSKYAAIWSDKYRGYGDPMFWRDQANEVAVSELRGKLLLISGGMDENVNLAQTLSLVDALMAVNKKFDLSIVPMGGHDIFLTHGVTQTRCWDFLVQHMLGAEPPEYSLRFNVGDIARMRSVLQSEARL